MYNYLFILLNLGFF